MGTNVLYVVNLHPDVTEEVLYRKFGDVGNVISVHVYYNRDYESSYAYIQFLTAEEAGTAITTFDNTLLYGRPMRCSYSQRGTTHTFTTNNVFVKNIQRDISQQYLCYVFSAFGTVTSCKIATDRNGDSRGYGFVLFDKEEQAIRAIENANGLELNGKSIIVEKYMTRHELDNKYPQTNIFFKNFGPLDEDTIKHIFGKYGFITNMRIVRDEEGYSRGFGFISFETPSSAMIAVDEMNGAMLANGRILYVAKAQKKSERIRDLRNKFKYNGCNLFVKNLDEQVTDELLKDTFETFGFVTSAEIRRINGRSRGFGFVRFSRAEEAATALSMMNGVFLGSKPIFINFAQSREERRRNFKQHFDQLRANQLAVAKMMEPKYSYFESKYRLRGPDEQQGGKK